MTRSDSCTAAKKSPAPKHRKVLRVAPLSRVLRYRNHHVVSTFRRTYAIDAREVERLWQDMLRLLWLTQTLAVRGEHHGIALHAGQDLVDELWHAFLLHTEDYGSFCQRYLGTFLHHRPASAERTRKREGAGDAEAFRRTVELTYDLLGREVALRWYLRYPKRYTPGFLESRRKMLGRQAR